jgi:hypothetical protein
VLIDLFTLLLTAVVSVIRFVVHDQLVVDKVEAVAFRFEWVVNHFLA